LTTAERGEDESDQEEDELPPDEVRVIQESKDGVTASVKESLHRQQKDDLELGDVIVMRIADGRPPSKEKLQTHTELTKKMVTRWEDLEIYDGLVYRRKKSPRAGEPDFMQLLLPCSQVEEALHQCHAGTVAGHFGIQKTMDQVRRGFYWSTWKADTKRFCQQCPECTGYHRGKLAKQGPLQSVLPRAPYERWYIDLTDPHPKSDRGNILILTCIDGWTKWAEAFPLRNKLVETVAKVLVEQVFTRFGAPLSILSDQGKEVDGRIMAEVCRLFGIEKLRTTPYKPSTNQVERFHRTMNSVLAKTVAETQRDWDIRLPYVMAAFRATHYDTTGYSPNFLVLRRETRAPPDLVYGSPEEENDENYDRFVEQMRERLVTAYTEVRQHMQRSAEKNKRYYDLGLRPKKFEVGQWVLYFNPRKLRGKQMKWCRQFEGPYLVITTPSSVTAKIQHTAKMTAKTVHIDKLKAYLGTPPRSWLPAATNDDNRTADPESATSLIPPDILIGPMMSPSAEQQPTPRPARRRRTDAGKQRGLGQCIPSPTLPTSTVEEKSSMLPDSWRAVESLEAGDCSVRWDTNLTPVKEVHVDTLPVDGISTAVKIPLTDNEPANVLEEMTVDAPAIDHVTTSAAVVSGRENMEIAETPLPDPTVVHATPAGTEEMRGRSVASESWRRDRAHPSVVRQRSRKGRNPSIAIAADLHSAYGNDNARNIMPYSQSPPGDDVPCYPLKDRTADTDRSIIEGTKRPSPALNPLAGEFVPASVEFGKKRDEDYSVDWAARESRQQRNRRLPSRYADFQMDGKNVRRSSTASTTIPPDQFERRMNQRPPTDSES